MDEDKSKKLDINSASAEELASLPGVGPAIATRILSARPFDNVEDLQKVRGLSSQKVERLRAKVNLSQLDKDAATPEAFETSTYGEETSVPSEDVVDQGELPPSEIPPRAETFEKASEEETAAKISEERESEEDISAEEKAIVPMGEVQEEVGIADGTHVTRGQALLMTLIGSVFAVVLTIALILGILNGINGGLRFVTPAQLLETNREIDSLQSDVEQFQDELDGFRTRMDNLDALSSRVEGVEATTTELHTDLESATSQLDEMQDGLDRIANQVDELRGRSDSFEGFLQGLQDLLKATLEEEVE